MSIKGQESLIYSQFNSINMVMVVVVVFVYLTQAILPDCGYRERVQFIGCVGDTPRIMMDLVIKIQWICLSIHLILSLSKGTISG